MDDEDFLGLLLDATTDTDLKLPTGNDAGTVMMLPGLLEEETRSEEVHDAAGQMRFCLGSRLVLPAEATGPRRPQSVARPAVSSRCAGVR
ncbi:hypothetical protein OG906_38285 (plasmid) [Streptomyces sp. NBC_01426]|uniref:hypothetical protein n=1 Tax=Streptomyces sp. NBC_01426 TaxID=2975866 RepID=UPI002E332657|nr:hypothetical protein [Streptomyces sp. NBC_01426]